MGNSHYDRFTEEEMVSGELDNLPRDLELTLSTFKVSAFRYFAAVQLLSHVRLCNHMDVSTSGFTALHYLSQFAQTHVH